jgi:hypothetical protein
MSKIYWFSIDGDGKSGLEERLVEFLQTDKRNWRSKVFYIDTKYDGYDMDTTLLISKFIQKNGCDVVVSSYDSVEVETIDNTILFNITHQKLKKSEFIPKTDGIVLEINTAMEGQSTSFNRIIHHILEKNKF